MPKEKMVCVEWEDAASCSGYYDKDVPHKFEPVATRTVGHLVRSDKKGVVLSQDRFYDHNGKIDDDRHLSIIPKKMIKHIIILREV